MQPRALLYDSRACALKHLDPAKCSGGRYYQYRIDTFDIWIQFHSIDIGNETRKLSIDTSAVNVQRKYKDTRPKHTTMACGNHAVDMLK